MYKNKKPEINLTLISGFLFSEFLRILDLIGAWDWTRTSTLSRHPLKMVCLPISPPRPKLSCLFLSFVGKNVKLIFEVNTLQFLQSNNSDAPLLHEEALVESAYIQ